MGRWAALLMFVVLTGSHSWAQTSVSGNVIDKSSRQPVEFASVQLIHLPDSTPGAGTTSDRRGRFTIDEIKPGKYFIRASFIGFEEAYSLPFELTGSSGVYRAGQIEITTGNKSLGEVTVTTRKSLLNTSIDRKVYHVDQDIMSRSGSASDLLKNIPSVEVDLEGSVSLRGSGDVMILINGKPSPLMGRSKAEVLQQLPANSIERIEVITNPSARYRPDGTSGIINIVLKKNIRNGFNGSLTANAGTRDRYNANVLLNYKPKNINLFSSYSFRRDYRFRTSRVDRTYYDSSTGAERSYFFQSNSSSSRPFSNIFNAGVDYSLNKYSSLGVSGSLYYRDQVRTSVVNNINYDRQKNIILMSDRLLEGPESEKQPNITAYFQHQFPKEEHELRIEFSRSVDNEEEENSYNNVYQLPVVKSFRENISTKTKENENQLTVDYTNPIDDDSKLEAGYDGQYTRVGLDFLAEEFDAAQNRYVKDPGRSNLFNYRDNIHALYATFQKGYERFGFSVGIRGEGAFTESHLLTLDSVVTNDYFKLYPTVHFSYKLKENTELQLNYSKRVNRPDADELNPFPEYQDPRNLWSGNPKLLPEIIHSIELGYRWQNRNFSFVPSVYFRYKENGFTSVTLPLDDSTLLTTNQNLANDQSAGLELIFSAKAGTWFSTSLSSNIFYNQIDAGNLGYITNKSIYSMSANLNTSFNLSKTTFLQVSANYRSARLTPQGKRYPNFVMNSGLRQDLFNNKLSFTFTVSDVWRSLQDRRELNTAFLKQTTSGRRDGQIFYAGISYRFGNIKKEKEERLQFDDNL